MKYIKTFEDIDTDQKILDDKFGKGKYQVIDVFKKYFVWEMRCSFSISKFEKIENGMVYFFDFKLKKHHNLNIEYAKRHIVYMSDNFKDCEIFIDLLKTAKKYNI